MASLESTAYPQFLSFYSTEDLKQFFTVEAEDLEWLKSQARSASTRLGLGVLLKCFQHLWYFPSSVDAAPPEVIDHIREALVLLCH